MSILTEPAVYQGSDTSLNAFLILKGCKILRTEKIGPRVTLFFNELKKCERLERDYYNRVSKVAPLDYNNALKIAKNHCFRELRRTDESNGNDRR